MISRAIEIENQLQREPVKVKGIYLAESVADATAAICCIIIFTIVFPKILAKGSMKK